MSWCGSFYIYWTQWTCFKLNVWTSHQSREIIFSNFFGNFLLPTILFSLFLVFPLFRWEFITKVFFFFLLLIYFFRPMLYFLGDSLFSIFQLSNSNFKFSNYTFNFPQLFFVASFTRSNFLSQRNFLKSLLQYCQMTKLKPRVCCSVVKGKQSVDWRSTGSHGNGALLQRGEQGLGSGRGE